MKTLKFTALVLGLFALLAGTTTLARAQGYDDVYQEDGYSNDANISLQTFYDELSPYGTWIQDPQYGYVWRPDIDQRDFRPYYTNGRWVMTEYGNTWVSNYDWGWAPFHYGRWVINSYRQWIWLPDTNWGPAWVDWRSGDGYYGWAPMAPTIGINLSFGRRYSVPEFCWNFIPQASIYINLFPRYDYGRNSIYYRNTTIINNTYVYNRRSYYGGPRMDDIRRATNRNVTVYRYNQSSRPGAGRISGREVSFYKPRPERNVDNRTAAPRKFEQGNAGFNRNGRNGDNANRGGNNGDSRQGQSNRGTDNSPNRGNNNPQNNGNGYNRGSNGRVSSDGRSGDANSDRGQQQQRSAQMEQQRAQRGAQAQQQRSQQEQQQRSSQMEQQRAQRDAQAQQQRSQQEQQQRSAQMEQQRVQRDAQAQQQRSQREQQRRSSQMEQQRAQRDAQAQQQRSQQEQQQRAQQQQQQQQQRSEQRRTEAPQQQSRGSERGGSESGRPSRGGRG